MQSDDSAPGQGKTEVLPDRFVMPAAPAEVGRIIGPYNLVPLIANRLVLSSRSRSEADPEKNPEARGHPQRRKRRCGWEGPRFARLALRLPARL